MIEIKTGAEPKAEVIESSPALDFIDALKSNLDAGANFSTITGHRVTYIPECRSPLPGLCVPCLEVTAGGFDALFYAGEPVEGGAIEIARVILVSGHSGAGESEIGIERLLTLDEKRVAAAVAMRPSATVEIKDENGQVREAGVEELMKLTLDEELALSNRQAELLAEARKLEAEHQAAVDVSNQAGMLHLVTTERPAGIE
jgi:hypothetical protein